MNRRKFIIYSSTGSALLGAGALNPWPLNQLLSQAMAAEICFELSIEEEMVPVFPTSPPIYMWAFKLQSPPVPTYTAYDLVAAGPWHKPPRVPGPVLTVHEGDMVCVKVTNLNTNPSGAIHSFAIAKRPFFDADLDPNPEALPEPDMLDPAIQGLFESPEIPYGQTVDIKFTAPAAGTYLYFDPRNNPINRIMGLHGVLVVLPARAPFLGMSPYTEPTDAVRRLFEDLGTSQRFYRPVTANGLYTLNSKPGEYWNPYDKHRNFIWVFNQIDEVHVNIPLQSGALLNPSQVRETFLPRYFTINGRTGFDSSHADENRPVGHIGEPVLIRMLNAGLATHSPHVHGNHVFVLNNNNHADGKLALAVNVHETDAFDLVPLAIKDVLHAYRQPPNIFPWPPSRAQFGLKGMVYPMHCHAEISASAAGGNYPQGAITDWVLLGPHQTRKIKI